MPIFNSSFLDDWKPIHNESPTYKQHKAFSQVYSFPPGWINFLVVKQGAPPSVFSPLDVGAKSPAL